MARQTRSSKPAAAATAAAPSTKAPAKKRKRGASGADTDGQPSPKHRRASTSDDDDDGRDALTEPDSAGEEEDDEGEPAQSSSPAAPTPEVEHPSVGELPLEPADAQKLLDVLEMIDTQGLLDRVFPLPTDAASFPPALASQTVSLRTLLQDPSAHPVRVLRSAISNLLPLHAHPRSRPSAAAQRQLRFCQHALCLLADTSAHLRPPPDLVPLVATPADPAAAPEPDAAYALLQRLPTGDWWSSLAHLPLDTGGPPALSTLATGHAELVALVPTPALAPPAPVPKLGALAPPRTAPPRRPVRMSWPRPLAAGSFATHGPYASFVPAYDGAGAELGRDALALFAWERARKAKVRATAHARLRDAVARQQAAEQDAVASRPVDGVSPDKGKQKAMPEEELASALDGLLPADEARTLADGLATEAAVDELLGRNARALERLQGLQLARLAAAGGGSVPGEEERAAAAAVEDTLVLLTALRPRGADDGGGLAPPAPALHAAQRALPAHDARGWRGTLAPARAKAVRDDRTLLVRPGVPKPAPKLTPAPPQQYAYAQYAQYPVQGGWYAAPAPWPAAAAVANTVAPRPAYGSASTGVGPTLPPHLRAGAPGTPAQVRPAAAVGPR